MTAQVTPRTHSPAKLVKIIFKTTIYYLWKRPYDHTANEETLIQETSLKLSKNYKSL